MIILYSKTQCPQCDQAKLFLDIKGVDYVVKTLGVDFTKEDLINKAPNVRSFPVVFKGEELIGGLLDLKKAV